jgi:hypothetical protein
MNRLAARLGAALLGAAAVVTLAAAPAQAAPTVSQVECESGASRFICRIAVSGTSGTVQIRWVFNSAPISAWNDRTLVSGGCGGNFTNYQVGATVTDATGSTSARGVLTCRTGPWI